MKTNLRTVLREKIASDDCDQTLLAMGYSARGLPAARARLHSVLADSRLGLASAQYDFRFGSREFLSALAHVLGLDSGLVAGQLESMEVELDRERRAFKPWIFVDTGFRRVSQPIFALAALEGKRRLILAADSWRLSRGELVAVARERVRSHYRDCQGRLALWGTIREYWLIPSDAEQVVLDVTGEVIQSESPKPISRAYLSLR